MKLGTSKHDIFQKSSTPQGAILLLDLTLSQPKFQPLELIGFKSAQRQDFHPHGISLSSRS